MKFVLFVEGHTEHKALPDFLHKWLDANLDQKAGIKTVRFNGWPELVKDLPVKAHMHLHGPGSEDTIAVIGLLDLYGPTFYPPYCTTIRKRMDWAISHLQKKVDDPRFRMYFAVHELEAWLLSDLNLFPLPVRNALLKNIQNPEAVNFETPPKKLLDRLYQEKLKRHYKELVNGKELFSRLDPNLVYAKCPNFAMMMDEMASLARNASS
jgi:hypothetical protein